MHPVEESANLNRIDKWEREVQSQIPGKEEPVFNLELDKIPTPSK